MKIFVRERQKVGEGVRQPMFRIVAVTGGQLQVQAIHFRRFEIEQIANEVGAEIVYLEPTMEEGTKKEKKEKKSKKH
jgi:hypothetical protein